jgi:hypothetical protein
LIADEDSLLRGVGDGAYGRRERTDGIEDGVAMVLPRLAMERVGAAIDGDIDDGTGCAAELGAVVVGLSAKLVDGIRRRWNRLVGEALIRGAVGVVVQAIEKKIIELRALPVDVERRVAAGDGLVLKIVTAPPGASVARSP